MEEQQLSGVAAPVVSSGSPSGARADMPMGGSAKTVEPPPNLPMAAVAGGPLVPPSAANPTIPPPRPSQSRATPKPVIIPTASKNLAPPPMVMPGEKMPLAPAPIPAPLPDPVVSVAAAPAPAAPVVTASSANPALTPPVPVASEVSSDPAVSDAAERNLELPTLSEVGVTFLTSRRYREAEAALAKDFDLTTDDLSFLNEMDHMVLGNTIKLDGYVRAMRLEFPSMPADQKEKLIARLLSERFLPWGEELKPSAAEVARKESLKLPAVPYYSVYIKPLTYSGAAGEVARAADIPSGSQMRERLRDLVMSRSKGIRLDAQVEEQIIRPLDLGGLGLEREKARQVVQMIADIISRARLMSEDEYSTWLAEEARRKSEASKPIVTVSKGDDEDGKEIAAIVAKMPKQVRDTSSILALSTQTILGRLSVKPEGAYLMSRLENIISTRLRDVRSRNEVLQKLMRDAKVGGVGMPRADAEKITAQIEEGYEEFRALIAQEEKEKSVTQSEEQMRKVEERKKREAEEHARWFQEKVQGKRVDDEAKKQLYDRMRVIAQGLTTPITLSHPMDAKEQAREKVAFGDLVPAAQANGAAGRADSGISAIVTPPMHSAPGVFAEVKTAPPVSSPVAAPRRMDAPVVKVSAASAKAAQVDAATTRPRMDDVRVMRTRLSGPMQEIEGLTLSSFRRLGKTPSEAAARIEQKIELLGQESFERRIDAIRAWQASPLQKSYLGLVAEAFSKATPVKVLVEQKRAAGEDALTAEELGVIVAMNGKMHF